MLIFSVVSEVNPFNESDKAFIPFGPMSFDPTLRCVSVFKFFVDWAIALMPSNPISFIPIQNIE